MTSPSAGIQQLLAAEKKAADKVGEARKRKENRSDFVHENLKVVSCDRRKIVVTRIFLCNQSRAEIIKQLYFPLA